ncbi:MAG: DUF1015 domain-containing protein [Flavobacteriales bacterium]|nr:DUF1015 domain-containing protein [Flavobacteriales bacterium]
MIRIHPFRAWRPTRDKAHLVATRSFVSYTPERLREKLADNPYSFLHIIQPDGLDPHAPRAAKHAQVRASFQHFCAERILERDPAPALYLYEQSSRGNVSRGLLAGVSVQDYRAGHIRIHEQTLTAREALFTEYLGTTGINAEPVLLATDDHGGWLAALDPVLNTRPEQDFTTGDRVRHRLWPIEDPALIARVQQAFSHVPALYIADGHHRMASSARLAEANAVGEDHAQAWCLAFIVPRPHLYIYNFDRAVTTLGGQDERTFLQALARVGRLKPTPSPVAAPGVVGVRTAGGWHTLELPLPAPGTAPADRLDAARLSALVLAPLLGIADLRTDARVRFIPGIEGTAALDRMVQEGQAEVGFHLHPVDFNDLRAVADSGGTMPPKSTYIEPKLRSGLIIHPLED